MYTQTQICVYTCKPNSLPFCRLHRLSKSKSSCDFFYNPGGFNFNFRNI